MYDSKMFEKFILEGIAEGVKRYQFWEKSMKEFGHKLAEKKETKKLIKELEAEYESKRGYVSLFLLFATKTWFLIGMLKCLVGAQRKLRPFDPACIPVFSHG